MLHLSKALMPLFCCSNSLTRFSSTKIARPPVAAMAVAYVAHVVVAAVVPHTFQILGQNMPEFCRNLGFFRKIYDTMLQSLAISGS
jgi:hypothetical protein